MFIQLKDIDNNEESKQDSVFILSANTNQQTIYVSRPFADYKQSKYTSQNKEHALIYFNRQSATEAIVKDFGYTGLKFTVNRIPVGVNSKKQAREVDNAKKAIRKEARQMKGDNHGTNRINRAKY